MDNVGDSTIILRMAGWIAQNDTEINLARSEAIRITMRAFDAAGIAMPEPTFRLMSANGAAAPAPKPAPTGAESRPPAPAPDEVQDVTASANRDLEQIASQERAAGQTEDLLSHAAPEE